MAVTPDNLHEFMHPTFYKALNAIATPSRTAWQIWERTTEDDLKEMLDWVAIYVGKGEFEKTKNGKYSYGADRYHIEHCYKD